jgi:antagonist of KipI
MTSMSVVKAGMLTTIQDLGRRGYQGLGVPVSGPMDVYSHRLANQLVGNAADAAALEITLMGPELVVDGDVTCAITGADISVAIDGRPAPMNEPFTVRGGRSLKWGHRISGARQTLAVRGGFDVPVTLGSRATHLTSRMGPFGGRSLRPGDVLPIGDAPEHLHGVTGHALEVPLGGARLRVLPAVHRDRFTEDAWGLLTHARFTISPQSNRMGYRLDGPVLTHAAAADILSEAMPLGAIQVPSSGQPILLLAERATTGGYATIGCVITADIPVAGQLAPGDWIEFDEVTRDDAIAALRRREAALRGVTR